MGMPAIRRRWTTDDVRALMDESRAWPRYELIGGELIVTPAPGFVHQIAVTEILLLLGPYVVRENMGITLASPADLELQRGEITQPDVFVVPLETSPNPDGKPTWADVTRLLLAVEVLSPSSVRTDRVQKREFYMDAGVPEYWVVDVDARIVERWTPGRETPTVFRETLEWRPEGATTSLITDLGTMFERIWNAFRRIDIRPQ